MGLFGALCAAKRGLAVTLLDRGFRGYSRGHATLLHPATLRLMSEYGLSAQLLAAGRPIASIDLRLDQEFTANLKLTTPALTIAQSVFEEILLKELHGAEVDIQTPWEANSLVQMAAGVEVRATRRELIQHGSPVREADWQPVESTVFYAQFVLGADGRESRVRSALGIETSNAGPPERYAMFDAPRQSPLSDFALSFWRGLGDVALPLADSCGRWGFQIENDAAIVPDVDHLRALLVERAMWEPELPDQVHWSAVNQFDRRLARAFGRGRVWLAGDAAHVTSPFGGQSVNGGLLEVCELVELMAGCLSGSEAIDELDRASARREREWQKLLGFHTRIETRPGLPHAVAEYAPRIIPALPASGRDLQYLLSQLGVTAY